LNLRSWNRRWTVQLLEPSTYPHNHTGGKGRTSKQGRDSAFRNAPAPTRLDTLFVPHNEGDFAKKVAGSQRSIGAGHCIALGLNTRSSRAVADRHYAMGNEPEAAAEHHDVAREDLVAAGLLNHERIVGPDGGQHAPSRDAQMQAAGRAQHFSRQFTLDGVRITRRLSRTLHDTFELLAQAIDEVPIFPHERAVVTNTFS